MNTLDGITAGVLPEQLGSCIATLIITLLYITFIFSFTELTTSHPACRQDLLPIRTERSAPWGGSIAGYATMIEFLLAHTGHRVCFGQLHALPLSLHSQSLHTAIACYVIFTLIKHGRHKRVRYILPAC